MNIVGYGVLIAVLIIGIDVQYKVSCTSYIQNWGLIYSHNSFEVALAGENLHSPWTSAIISLSLSPHGITAGTILLLFP